MPRIGGRSVVGLEVKTRRTGVHDDSADEHFKRAHKVFQNVLRYGRTADLILGLALEAGNRESLGLLGPCRELKAVGAAEIELVRLTVMPSPDWVLKNSNGVLRRQTLRCPCGSLVIRMAVR